MFCVDEVITRKEVSVVFDDGNITAGLLKDANRMLLPESSSGRLLEYLHFDPLDILVHPLIEDGAEKIAQSLSRHSAMANAALFVWLRLNQGQKLQVLGFDLLEEPVNLDGVLDVLCMHHAKYIARDLVLAQELIPMHRLLVGGVVPLGDAVPIVHFLRTVQTKPYAKALCR
jgi:aromatic ring-cleaving dioxygenase